MNTNLCYLDNAATTFPKPRAVINEVRVCLEKYSGNAARSSHKLSLAAANKVYDCREELAALINLPHSENISFLPSCTFAASLVIKGLAGIGDHILISDCEHNCIWRPLEKLRREEKITYDVFPALSLENPTDSAILSEIKSKIKPTTRLLFCTHQSNICSFTLPVKKIGELCKKHNILFALDAAQSIGHVPIDMEDMNINYLIAPGHKGLYGPQGCGFLAINSDILPDTLVEGGNGIYSLSPEMPNFLPERYESGTLPLPAIAGLCEGVREVKKIGISAVSEHERKLFRRLRDGILSIEGTTVYKPMHEGSTLLFNLSNYGSEEAAALFDASGICLRSGFHCAALAHRAMKTDSCGALRASFGIFNTERDADRLINAISKAQSARRVPH